MAVNDAISLLVVDDEANILMAFQNYLENDPDFTVTICASAEEALELLALHQFDVIISDVAMPNMDGIAFLREVRARDSPAIFVVITGKRLAHIAIDAINAGADHYVQKGADFLQDIKKLLDYVRVAVPKQRALRELQSKSDVIQSKMGNQTDIFCQFSPDGTIKLANTLYSRFIGVTEGEIPGSNFFFLVPDAERTTVLNHLKTLSPALPGIILEHHVVTGDGSSRLLQWHYHIIHGDNGRIAGYQASGRETDNIVRIGREKPAAAVQRPQEPASPKKGTVIIKKAPVIKSEPLPAPAPTPAGPLSAEVTPNDRRMIDETINGLDNPVFAIDKNGVVIAWNKAIEQLTGVEKKSIIGRGNYAHSLPFYGKPVPMLIDYIFSPPASSRPGTIEYKKMGDTYIGDTENVMIKGKPMLLWGKVTAAYNAKGSLIGAVEFITVADPEGKGQVDDEKYIGGISSLTLKVSGEGLSGSIAGAIGATSGGYGIYATTTRVFVIRNPELDVSNPDGVKFGTFIMSEFFGTMIDTSPRSIASLEQSHIFEAAKDSLTVIELKKPVMLAGSVTFRTKTSGLLRVYIDHKKSYVQIEELMKAFSPDIVRME